MTPARDAAAADPSDADLAQKARAGSRAAFEALVRRYQRPLYHLCFRYVREHDAAADLAQRAFIKAMDGIVDLRDAGTFRGWLFRIGANLALNHLRDHARFVAETAAEAVPGDASAPPDLALLAREDGAALRRLVERLPTKQRMTVELRIYEDLPFRDVAAALETTEGAAKVNFHYAIRKLRLWLGSKPDKTGEP
jgi:RNA polymerase sigma-70 factor (ECF subfamily)